jgi:hypothetical protein
MIKILLFKQLYYFWYNWEFCEDSFFLTITKLKHLRKGYNLNVSQFLNVSNLYILKVFHTKPSRTLFFNHFQIAVCIVFFIVKNTKV